MESLRQVPDPWLFEPVWRTRAELVVVGGEPAPGSSPGAQGW